MHTYVEENMNTASIEGKKGINSVCGQSGQLTFFQPVCQRPWQIQSGRGDHENPQRTLEEELCLPGKEEDAEVTHALDFYCHSADIMSSTGQAYEIESAVSQLHQSRPIGLRHKKQ